MVLTCKELVEMIKENKDNYKMLKKEMYKHKEKLMGNNVSEDIVLYKQGMSVSDLAESLNISGTDIIKKLMSLGLMLGLNDSIDFETASWTEFSFTKLTSNGRKSEFSSLITVWSSETFLEVAATEYPSANNFLTNVKPKPFEAPVTNHTFFVLIFDCFLID